MGILRNAQPWRLVNNVPTEDKIEAWFVVFYEFIEVFLGYATTTLKTEQTCRGFEVTASGAIRVNEVINAAEIEAADIIALAVYNCALLILLAFGYRDSHCPIASEWFATGPVVDLQEFVVLWKKHFYKSFWCNMYL